MKKSTKSNIYGIAFVAASFAAILVLGYLGGTAHDAIVKALS